MLHPHLIKGNKGGNNFLMQWTLEMRKCFGLFEQNGYSVAVVFWLWLWDSKIQCHLLLRNKQNKMKWKLMGKGDNFKNQTKGFCIN